MVQVKNRVSIVLTYAFFGVIIQINITEYY